MTRSEKETVKSLYKAYNKLCKGNTRGLGQFLMNHCDVAIKEYMPEVWEIAFPILCDFDTANITPRMEFEIGMAFLSAKRGE